MTTTRRSRNNSRMLRPRQRGEIEFIPANRRKSAREPDRTSDSRACVHSACRVYIAPPSPWRPTTFLSGQAIAAPAATGMLCPIAPPVSARCRKALATRRHPTGFGHACYGFRPSERDAFSSTEYVSRIAPHRRIILVAFCFFEFLHSQGHSRRFGDVRDTSAFPPIADARRKCRRVRKVVPMGVIAGLV